jgi:Asp-tRNA(Asn)/Glu-tRNA(Gln) amidotransferase B subunit
VLSSWNDTGIFAVEPGRLGELVAMVADGTLSLISAKRVYAELGADGGSPRAVAERLGVMQVRDTEALAEWIDTVLAANPKEVERYRNGETRLIGFFVGQVMKRSAGKADPKAIQPIIVERLAP